MAIMAMLSAILAILLAILAIIMALIIATLAIIIATLAMIMAILAIIMAIIMATMAILIAIMAMIMVIRRQRIQPFRLKMDEDVAAVYPVWRRTFRIRRWLPWPMCISYLGGVALANTATTGCPCLYWNGQMWFWVTVYVR